MTLCLDYISQASQVAPALNKMNEKIQQTIPKQENHWTQDRTKTNKTKHTTQKTKKMNNTDPQK